MKSYYEISKVFDREKINDLDGEIVSCVRASLCGKRYSENVFNSLCGYVRHIWDILDKPYTQLISDIIADLFVEDLDFGYREEAERTLDLEDLNNHSDDNNEMILYIYSNHLD